jgi:hypothetical protein
MISDRMPIKALHRISYLKFTKIHFLKFEKLFSYDKVHQISFDISLINIWVFT